MDGEITIGTSLSTDKFDRQVAQLERKMQKEEEKKIVIDAKLGSQQEELDKARQKTDALADAYQRLNEVQDRLATKQATPKEFTTFQDLQNTYGSLEKLGTEFDRALTKQNAIEQKVAQTKYRYDEINAKVSEYKQKIENVKIQKQVADVEKLKSGFNSVGSSIQGAVKHVARLALGIFGIRSAYMILRQASSQLGQYDQQYATNLEYIRYALTQMIAPVLKTIIHYVLQGLQYINMLLNGLFGINLFTNASADAFNRMKKGASGVSSAVKEIKKDLLGFDEINRLTDDGNVSAGANGTGMPSINVADLQGKTPKWLQDIINNAPAILATLGAIAGFLLAIKLHLTGIKALGFGAVIFGVVKGIQDLIKYLNNPAWENFYNLIGDIGIAILGVGLIIDSVPLMIAGALTLILSYIAKHWEEVKKGFNAVIDWIKGLGQSLWDWFFENIDNIQKHFGYLGVGIVAVLVGVFDWLMNIVAGIVGAIRDILDGLFKGVKDIFDGIIMMFQGNFAQGFIKILKGILNAIIGALNGLISGINGIIYPVRSLIAGLGQVFGKNWTVDNIKIPKIPYVKTGAIINMPNKGTLVGSALGGESGRERSNSFNRPAGYE